MAERPEYGVILSAGKGSRIDPFNAHWPKPLLPIGNRPILGHHIEIFKSLGITKVKIVVGHLMDKIINHFGRGEDVGVEIEYVEQRATLGIAHAAGAVASLVDGPFILSLGDIYYQPQHLETLLDTYDRQGGGAVLAVMPEEDPESLKKNFSIELDDRGLVRRVVEKPRILPNNLKGCGIYLFGPEVFDAIRKTPRTAFRDEYEITNSIQILIDDGYPVGVAEVVAWDRNLTFPRDLLDGNLQYLDHHSLENLVADDAFVDEGATLSRCVVGAGARIESKIKLGDAVVLPGTVVNRDGDFANVIVSPENWFQC